MRVEKEAAAAGKTTVGLGEVKATQKRYLRGMAAEVKGFQLEACFGPGGCPNRTVASDRLVAELEQVLQRADLLPFLKTQVGPHLKFHHNFRVSVADCPNACSHPQIKDIGIIGAVRPAVTDTECSRCGECVATCPDDAISLDDAITISGERCMACGKCVGVCPTGTLGEGQKGYRILLGGKLGRHPRLATDLPGIYSHPQVLAVVAAAVALFKRKSRGGKRFAEILSVADIRALTEAHPHFCR